MVFTRDKVDLRNKCIAISHSLLCRAGSRVVELGRADAVSGCCCQLPMGLSDLSGCKSLSRGGAMLKAKSSYCVLLVGLVLFGRG